MRRLLPLVFPVTLAAQAPESAAPPTADQLRADLAQTRSAFLAVDKSFAPTARVQAEQRLAKLEAAVDTLHLPYFTIELARIAALADNGHTAVVLTRSSSKFNRVGVRFTPMESDFRVLATHAPFSDLLGARLVAIDGHSIDALRAAARTLRGGVDGWRDRWASYLFESPELMQAMGLAARADAAMYEFERPDGTRVSRRLVGDAPDTVRARAQSTRWMSPEPPPADGHEWRSLITVEQAPWSLREPGNPFRVRHDSALNAVVAQFRMNTGSPTRSIESFIKEIDSLVSARTPTNFVLDMRFNGGGNLNTTRDFVQRLAKNIPGTIVVLTSPGTFSAAISTVGYLKQAAPEKVKIVGEPVGDRLEFWAEGPGVALTRSGIVITYATERHDYANGCKAYTDCHGSVVRNPIAVPSLAPEISAPWTFAAYRAGRDPGMEAVARLVAGR